MTEEELIRRLREKVGRLERYSPVGSFLKGIAAPWGYALGLLVWGVLRVRGGF